MTFQTWISVDFCAQSRSSCFLDDFASIFDGKNNEKSIEKTMHVFTVALVFFSMANLTKHRILRYESYFFIFCDSVFFNQKHRKNHLKMQRPILDPKIHPKCPPGARFGTQNGSGFASEGPKIPKMTRKTSFLEESFLEHFLIWILIGFWGPEPGCIQLC